MCTVLESYFAHFLATVETLDRGVVLGKCRLTGVWHRSEIVPDHRKDLSATGNFLSLGQTRVANFVCVCMWGCTYMFLKSNWEVSGLENVRGEWQWRRELRADLSCTPPDWWERDREGGDWGHFWPTSRGPMQSMWVGQSRRSLLSEEGSRWGRTVSCGVISWLKPSGWLQWTRDNTACWRRCRTKNK